jgi:N-acetyl sugar amidotransferase
MDTSDPWISFASNGHCNHCTKYLEHLDRYRDLQQGSEVELARMVERLQSAGRGRPYDCVIGVSGGVDSCYLLSLAKSWGLRPLAVHMDNGWNTDEAVRNILVLCEHLDIDYQSYVLDWEEFKNIQLAFLKASIIELEIPTDIAILGSLHRVAAKFNVKYILSGSNFATEGILPRAWFYYPKDAKLLRSICQQFYGKPIKSFPFFDYPQEIYYKLIKGIRMQYPLNFVKYDKEDAKNTLISKYAWKNYGAKHHESRYTKLVHGYIHPEKFKIDYRRAFLSAEIGLGRATRDEALEQLAKPAYDANEFKRDLTYAAKKFGLTPEELKVILDYPVKTYADYPNNEKFLKLLYKVYRILFGRGRSIAFASYES